MSIAKLVYPTFLNSASGQNILKINLLNLVNKCLPEKYNFIPTENVSPPKTIPAGEPRVVPTNLNVHEIPSSLTVIPVNKDSLITFTPGLDTSSFFLFSSTEDTLPTGVPIPVKGNIVPCRQPCPVKALPPVINENTSINLKYLIVH